MNKAFDSGARRGRDITTACALDEFGAPPGAPHPVTTDGVEFWRSFGIAWDHHIEDSPPGLRERSGVVAQRLRQGLVDVVIDLARKPIHRPCDGSN